MGPATTAGTRWYLLLARERWLCEQVQYKFVKLPVIEDTFLLGIICMRFHFTCGSHGYGVGLPPEAALPRVRYHVHTRAFETRRRYVSLHQGLYCLARRS